jgi:hypothetical protein
MEIPTDQASPVQEQLVDRTRALLQAHVPLSLLLDLADPSGPDSAGHFVEEPADLSWLRPVESPR